MLAHRLVASALVAACLCLIPSTEDLAADTTKPTAKIRKKAPSPPMVSSPTGAKGAPDAKLDAPYDAADTIAESTNELGQKVYWIKASHFDISPPLREMAAAAAREADVSMPSGEPSEDPKTPAWLVLRSDVPDPVVQAAVPAEGALREGGVGLAAPTMGFNFDGIGFATTHPPDCNGSVGGDQFVETVNSQYQVWSLDRTTMVATSVLGPLNLNTLWTGFDPCQNADNTRFYDPIVIFDKTARRWVIQAANASTPNQCVAVSTSADATGTYARYVFPFPPGVGSDPDRISAWPPSAYLYTSHVNSLFGGMDRAKMLAGDPGATWILIEDPNEFGQTAADLDGFALPPTSAPGVFVAVHPESMYVYRVKFSFSSGVATKTLQAIVPVAPFSGACNNGNCIPQPGTGQKLASLGDRLAWRAAYRNFIDHESLVVSHAVDPSVTGVESGVRWYDIRLSGPPDASCPTYLACISREHSRTCPTAAAGGRLRSRWTRPRTSSWATARPERPMEPRITAPDSPAGPRAIHPER